MDYKKQFRKETTIDLEDYEYVGTFPYYNNKKKKWSTVSRGEGWRRYALWLEKKLKSSQKSSVLPSIISESDVSLNTSEIKDIKKDHAERVEELQKERTASSR